MSNTTKLDFHPIQSLAKLNFNRNGKIINRQNSAFCQRMINKKPAINFKKFESDHMRSEYYKSRISQHTLVQKSKQNSSNNNSLLNTITATAGNNLANITNVSNTNENRKKIDKVAAKSSSDLYNPAKTNTFNGFNIARNLNAYPGMKLCNRLDVDIMMQKEKPKLFTKLFESKLLIIEVVIFIYIYYITLLEFIIHIDDGWEKKVIVFNKIMNLSNLYILNPDKYEKNCISECICYIENGSYL